MPPTLTTSTPPVFQKDVLALAAERGVTEYLAPLLDLTRQCFPGASVSVVNEDDAEIAGLRWVAFEVDAAGRDADQLFDGQRRWTEAFVRTCPPAAREAFALGMR